MKKKTQCERILDYISDFGSITSFEAIRDLGCMRLASRICDLKRQGYKFYRQTRKRQKSIRRNYELRKIFFGAMIWQDR